MIIKTICDTYGYGNVMEWASALWRYSAKENNYPIEGCFVPTCPDFIKKNYRCPQQHLLYDQMVEEIMKNNN